MTIRQSLMLLASLCACSPLLNAQEVKHAPTVEQCGADQKLWLSKLKQSAGAGVADVSFDELRAWALEMGDGGRVFHWRYYNTAAEARIYS